MSSGCQQVISSRIKVAIIPNTTCAASPTIHQVEATVAGVAGDTSLTISLDTAYTAGGYGASSKFALVPGTILNFGAVAVTVADPTDGSGVYFITTTAAPINVVALSGAVALNATAQTYFAIPLCLKNANVTTNTTQVDNTTNCTGTLFTQINTGFMKMLELGGFLASGDYGYFTLSSLGKELQSAFFAIDYDRRFFTSGVVQLTDPSITDSAVKQLAGWTIQGQIQSLDSSYGSYLTSAEQTANATARKLYGFDTVKSVFTVS